MKKKEYLVCPFCGSDDLPPDPARNAGRCKACKSKQHKAWYAKRGQDYFLGKSLGITADVYRALHEAQAGVCALCKKPESATDSRTGQVRRLSVDHDHSTGKIRGLLCRACNQGLGSFRDNAQVMRDAAQYVEDHK